MKKLTKLALSNLKPVKTCISCKKTFPNTEEYFVKRSKNVLKGICRVCNNKRKQENYKENKDKNKKYYFENIKKIKDKNKRYYNENKDIFQKRSKKYREENKEKIKENKKQYYEENKKEISEKNKQYVKNNSEKIKLRLKKYQKENSEALKIKSRERYVKDIEKRKKQGKEYYENNKEEIKERAKKYREENPEQIKKYREGLVFFESNLFQELSIYEETRQDPKNIVLGQAKCAYCGNWINPTNSQTDRRMKAINEKGGCYFYCEGPNCRNSCPVYKQVKFPKGFRVATSRESNPLLRQLVLKRDNYTCQHCGATIDEAPLHCHHVVPARQNPMTANDPNVCITLCKSCHISVHKTPGCTYQELKCSN